MLINKFQKFRRLERFIPENAGKDRPSMAKFLERKPFKPSLKIAVRLLLTMLVSASLFMGLGCTQKKKEDDYLLRVGNRVMTVSEFNQAVDAAGMEAFSGEKKVDPVALNDLRLRVLNQATEEMIIASYAADQGIHVSDEEVDNAVAAVKADYPDNTFEETLLENAVSFQYWKKRLASRMLVEKVISKELVQQVQISADDIAEYYKTNYPQGLPENENADEINQRIVNHLRQQKAETAYKDWLDTLRQAYPVDINRGAWDRLIGATS